MKRTSEMERYSEQDLPCYSLGLCVSVSSTDHPHLHFKASDTYKVQGVPQCLFPHLDH